MHEDTTPERKSDLPPLKTGEIELTNEETRKRRPDATRLSVSGADSRSANDRSESPKSDKLDESNKSDTSADLEKQGSSANENKQAETQSQTKAISPAEYERLQSENEGLKK